jgi:NitT/TauT family transport system ATP-binding protein
VTFSVGEQEFICIVGPSGCGKTTLLKLIAGLLKPTSGRIIFGARPADGRPRSALVFQEHGLFPWMTVLDNVAFGLEMRGVGREERRARARAFIEQVGLASFAHSYPYELSVGMRQRVGITRAFVADPQILLMDEPFGSLDAQTRLVLQEELLRIWKDYQKLVVYVTHDIEEAVLLGDRVLVMTGRPGSIREEILIPLGRPRDLSAREQPEVMEIKWHIWKMLEDEVRKSLWIPG